MLKNTGSACMELLMLINMESVLAHHIKLSHVALALLGLFIFSAVVQKLTNKLSPMVWPVFGITPTMFFHINNLYGWITNALIKNGGSFYYRGVWKGGSHGVMTCDPSNVEYILKTRFKNYSKGKYYRERFHDLLGDGIFNADDELWKEQRRATMFEMHSSQFLDYSFRNIQTLVHHKLLNLLEKLVKSGESIDLQEVLLRFTFDNVCITAFGNDPGCLAIDLPEVPFANAFEQATQFSFLRFTVPPPVWKMMKFFDIGSEKQLRRAVKVVHDFTEKTVSDRRLEGKKLGHLHHRSDMLSRLMDSEKYQFSDNLLKDFCISLILAGRDTSSVALTWFFWLIHEHPRVEHQILSELSSIISSRKTNEEINDVVFTAEEVKKMNYLQAALSESLRLYPSVPIDFKEVIEDDILPSGHIVQKGAKVIYVIYSMARAEAIWGKDCEEYKPERWLEDGQFKNQDQFKYAVFNSGPRLCVGKKFAYMQMKMIASSVLLRYSVKVVEGQSVVPKRTTTLYMQNGLLVTFKPRLSLIKN